VRRIGEYHCARQRAAFSLLKIAWRLSNAPLAHGGGGIAQRAQRRGTINYRAACGLWLRVIKARKTGIRRTHSILRALMAYRI